MSAANEGFSEGSVESGVFDAILGSQDIALGVLDADLRYVRVNDLLASMNGVPAKEHDGRTIHEVLPELAPGLEPVLREVLATNRPSVGTEISGATPAHRDADRHFVASYYPIRAEDRPIGILAVVVEVTDRVRFQRALRDQSRQIYENVAQDLTIVQLALAQGDTAGAEAALARALAASKTISSRVALEDIYSAD